MLLQLNLKIFRAIACQVSLYETECWLITKAAKWCLKPLKCAWFVVKWASLCVKNLWETCSDFHRRKNAWKETKMVRERLQNCTENRRQYRLQLGSGRRKAEKVAENSVTGNTDCGNAGQQPMPARWPKLGWIRKATIRKADAALSAINSIPSFEKADVTIV